MGGATSIASAPSRFWRGLLRSRSCFARPTDALRTDSSRRSTRDLQALSNRGASLPRFDCTGSPARSDGNATPASLICGRMVQRRADHETTRQTQKKVPAEAHLLIIQSSCSKSLSTSHMHQQPIPTTLCAGYSVVMPQLAVAIRDTSEMLIYADYSVVMCNLLAIHGLRQNLGFRLFSRHTQIEVK
jgi:hypothetical protein